MNNQNKNKIFFISGPSTVGKNTIVDGVKKLIPELEETVSCTTRQKRPYEKNKVHYHFLSKKEFEQKIKNDEFLEYFEVHGKYYGTLKSEIDRIIKNNHIPLAIIDVQGALYAKKHNPNVVLIFIEPDSLEILEKRLRARNIDSAEFEIRLKNAKNELMQAKFYNYRVINHLGKVKKAIQEVAEIIKKNRS